MFDFRGLVRVLVEHDVRFVIVGGLAGVLQGAPLNTRDLDILYALDEANATKLLAALDELGAVFRGDPRKLRPALSHLRSQGHKLLSTTKGDLDCLGTIEESTKYEDVVGDVDRIELDGILVPVLSLPRLIEVKRKLSRPKDQLALLQLRATLEERSKR
jgi:hypothetical protein